MELLRALVNRISEDPSAASTCNSLIVQHGLLSIDAVDGDVSTAAEQVDRAIQTADELLTKAEGSQRAAGAALLRAVAEECSSRRLLQGLGTWGAKALTVLRGTTDDASRAALLRVLQSLFWRVQQLLELPGVRQEGAGVAGKLAVYLRPFLQPEGEELGPMAELQALQTLAAALRAVPAALRSQLPLLERFICDRLCSHSRTGPTRLAASHCLSLLPSVTGQAEHWSNTAQNLLASAHSQLDAATMGLQDAAAVARYRSLVKPDAQPLATLAAPDQALSAAAMRLALQRLGAIMDCLERLLGQPAACPVPMPGPALLALCARALSVDDSLAGPGRAPPSASAFLELCASVPALHAAALRLLQTLLQVGGRALTPQHSAAGALLGERLRRMAAHPAGFLTDTSWLVRAEVYRACAVLIQRAGWGPVRDLTPLALPCLLLELYGSALGSGVAGKEAKTGKKKRKRQKAEQDDLAGIGAGSALAAAAQATVLPSAAVLARDASAQAAALQLAEALYMVGGATLGLQVRAQLDSMVAHHAATAAAAVQRASAAGLDASFGSALLIQLAALRALRASVLAPCSHRPPFLPRALALLRQGLASAIAEVQSFCGDALLACEALLHPRSAAAWPSAKGVTPEANGATQQDVTYLGVPRLWSALEAPASHAALDGGSVGGPAATMHIDEEPSGAGLMPALPNEHAASVRAADANGGPGHSVDRHAGEPQREAAPEISFAIQQLAAVPKADPAPSRPAPAEPEVLHTDDCAAGPLQPQHMLPGGGAAVEAQIGPSAAHEQIAKPGGGPAAENNAKEDLPNQEIDGAREAVQRAPAPALLEQDVSDSEGSMPSIDSGASENESSDDDEE